MKYGLYSCYLNSSSRYLSLWVSFNLYKKKRSQPGKEGGEGEGEHDGGDGVGEHEAEHQAGVRVLQDVSVLRNEDADDDDVDFNDGGDQKAEQARRS